MKNDTIQQLLSKYQQGTLTDEELSELSALTHKDEVMAAAFSRANTIVRRRTIREVALAMTGVIVIGAGVWMMTPGQEATVLMAENQELPAPTVVEEVRQEVLQPVVQEVKDEKPVLVAEARPVEKAAPREADVVVKPAASEQDESKPVVTCNTQCDADEVIDDIWKFLSA